MTKKKPTLTEKLAAAEMQLSRVKQKLSSVGAERERLSNRVSELKRQNQTICDKAEKSDSTSRKLNSANSMLISERDQARKLTDAACLKIGRFVMMSGARVIMPELYERMRVGLEQQSTPVSGWEPEDSKLKPGSFDWIMNQIAIERDLPGAQAT